MDKKEKLQELYKNGEIRKYKGQWVAVDADGVIGVGPSMMIALHASRKNPGDVVLDFVNGSGYYTPGDT